MPDASPVDVVVPIHNAHDELRACVESVFRHPQATPFRLVLIDDASTDPRMGDLLARLASAAPVPVLTMRNEANLGFAGTANRGLRLDAARDVVLLNSDTLVTPGWLDGLARCAASDVRIGTATPFSNNSTVSSFPEPDRENELARLPPVDVVARAIADAGARDYPDLPSAVGFCMYIRRAAIEAAGGFDAARYGRGYGEDNDFSVRVAQAGFRNVLCDDVFVAHVGSRSFGAERQALVQNALRALQEQHPGYAAEVRRFHRERPLEGQVVASRLRLGVAARPALAGVLHVLHGDRGGGTRLHVASLVAATAGRARGYALHCTEDEWELAAADAAGVVATRCFRRGDGGGWSDVWADLVEFLGIDFVHLHHLAGMREALLGLVASGPLPYGVTLHDHYLACPTTTMLGPDGMYCGAPVEPGRCAECLATQPAYRGIDIDAWRAAHAALLRGARFVVTPSRSLAETLRRYFPDLATRCIPHAMPPFGDAVSGPAPSASRDPAAPRVVAVLGVLAAGKGARRIQRIARLAEAERLPLRFVVIGSTQRSHGHSAMQGTSGALRVHGNYRREELPALLARYGVELVLFPSAGPEAFSYTLSEAWACGLPAVVPDLGALAERVRESGGGWVVPNWRDDEAMLREVERVLAPGAAAEYDAVRRRAQALAAGDRSRMAEETVALYEAAVPRRAEREPPSLRARRRVVHARPAPSRRVEVATPAPVRAIAELPPRNSPCPCGSGNRYKHCCAQLGPGSGASAGSARLAAEAMRRHQAGRVDEARALYDEALIADPGNGAALHYAGMVDWQSGDYERALERVAASIDRLPPQAPLFNNLGLCLASLWRYEDAADAYRQALVLDERYAEAHNNLGLCLRELGRRDEAAESFRRALALNPAFEQARWNLELCLREDPR